MSTFARKFPIHLITDQVLEKNPWFRDMLLHWRPAGDALHRDRRKTIELVANGQMQKSIPSICAWQSAMAMSTSTGLVSRSRRSVLTSRENCSQNSQQVCRRRTGKRPTLHHFKCDGTLQRENGYFAKVQRPRRSAPLGFECQSLHRRRKAVCGHSCRAQPEHHRPRDGAAGLLQETNSAANGPCCARKGRRQLEDRVLGSKARHQSQRSLPGRRANKGCRSARTVHSLATSRRSLHVVAVAYHNACRLMVEFHKMAKNSIRKLKNSDRVSSPPLRRTHRLSLLMPNPAF